MFRTHRNKHGGGIMFYINKNIPCKAVNIEWLLNDCEVTLIELSIKDTNWEKASSNETPGLTKSTNMSIWVVGTANQLFIRDLKLKQNFQKNKAPFFVIGPFCSYHFICLNIGFWYSSFVWKWCVFNLSAFN